MRIEFPLVIRFVRRLLENRFAGWRLHWLWGWLSFRFSAPNLSPLAEDIRQTLQARLREGHTCLSLPELATRCRATALTLQRALGELRGRNLIRQSAHHIALTDCAEAEEVIAQSLSRIGRRLRAIPAASLQQWLLSDGAMLSDEQRESIRLIANSPVSILTGAPGTGKTLTLKSLITIFVKAGWRVSLAAPTGRAAQRLQEATGHTACTLHRLLANACLQSRSWWEQLFPTNEVIIVDEASMVDVFLMRRLVSLCTPSARLILVGDTQQLASIGPGQVLHDLMESGCVPVVRLTTNYRQTHGSRIIEAADAIKVGNVPKLPAPGVEKSDCYFIEAETAAEIERFVVKVATQSLPARCGADPRNDIQILTPKHGGTLGTVALNEAIRTALQPTKENDQTSATNFTIGDRVLHTQNNYDLGVFNGQCGSVQAVDANSVTVQYGAREVVYTSATLPQLSHGFALSIHRSQGSEYPFVILPIHECQQPLLTRELLYTALTRGQKMVVLIGSQRALEAAINKTTTGRRQTLLGQLLARPKPLTPHASVLPQRVEPAILRS